MAFMEALGTGLALAAPIAKYFGDQADRNANAHAQRMNAAEQKEYAQQGIRWKVDDARAAGLHPLAALGASTASGGGSHLVGGGSEGGSIASTLGQMGQDVSRSIQATRTDGERQLANLQLANAQADLDGKTIENQIRASQLQKMNATGPAFPSAVDQPMISGQGNTIPGFKVRASEANASSRFNTGVQAGAINTLQYTREADGSLGIAPSSDAKERNEDDLVAESLWHFKNRLSPPPPDPREFPLPKGAKFWKWQPITQRFIPDSDEWHWKKRIKARFK